MNKIKKYLKNPFWIIPFLGRRNFFNWVPDKLYLKIIFRIVMGYWFDLNNPKTFNEKLQWLKIYDRQPLYSKLVDKYEVRQYVAEKIGEEHLIPLLGVWNSFDEIDFDKLPNQFVLKCTHDSQSVIICKDKSKFDSVAARRKITKHLKRNLFWGLREWPYKNVHPRIVAEKYMEDDTKECLTDFKYFCFDGKPKFMYVSHDIAKVAQTDFFDMGYNHLPIRMKDPNSIVLPSQNPKFEDMKQLAEILAKDFTHVRVDFYVISNCIYFGELTFYHNSGLSKISPKEWDKKLGDLINIKI
jgi:hypothetical protein